MDEDPNVTPEPGAHRSASQTAAADLLGMVVTSRAGRDAGDRYVVIGLAGADMVLVADGRRRGTQRPKRKNVKHLMVHGPAATLVERLRQGQSPTDEELRAALSGGEGG